MTGKTELQLEREFRKVVKGRNVMTPDLVGYYRVEGGVAELSWGEGFDRKEIFGVTVVREGKHDHGASKMFYSEAAAREYIEELKGEGGRRIIGRIVGFLGTWGSGIGYLRLELEDGGEVDVPCENAPTMRALESAFGGVIGEGHVVDPQGGHVGKMIEVYMDGFIMEGFRVIGEGGEE